MFGKRPLSSVTLGDLEDYKSWRRTVHKVREITLRHDLHALSLLFQYGQKHNWCRSNPVREVKIPSDQDAVRINVLSRAQEEAYFAAVESLRLEKAAAQRTAQVRALEDLDDPHRLMLRQGCRRRNCGSCAAPMWIWSTAGSGCTASPRPRTGSQCS